MEELRILRDWNLIELQLYDSSQDASVEDSESIRSVKLKKSVSNFYRFGDKINLIKCLYLIHYLEAYNCLLDINFQFDIVM